jgi:hypothetical protein
MGIAILLYYINTALSNMAGLGLFDQKSVRAVTPRGLLRSAYDFLCLIYCMPKGPGHRGRAQGSFDLRLKLFTQTFLIGSINRT